MASTRPPLTGGQRASAVLAGLVAHTLFAIGWFGVGFLGIGAILSALIGGFIRSALGEVEAAALQQVLDQAGAVVWIVFLVFAVGSVFFVVMAIIASGLILQRGDVHRPWGTTWAAVGLAAIVDVPIYLISGWITGLVTDSKAGLVFFPPLFTFILVLIVGAALWWWMAHALRAKAPAEPEPSAVPVPVPVQAVEASSPAGSGGDAGGEAVDPLQQSGAAPGQ